MNEKGEIICTAPDIQKFTETRNSDFLRIVKIYLFFIYSINYNKDNLKMGKMEKMKSTTEGQE